MYINPVIGMQFGVGKRLARRQPTSDPDEAYRGALATLTAGANQEGEQAFQALSDLVFNNKPKLSDVRTVSKTAQFPPFLMDSETVETLNYIDCLFPGASGSGYQFQAVRRLVTSARIRWGSETYQAELQTDLEKKPIQLLLTAERNGDQFAFVGADLDHAAYKKVGWARSSYHPDKSHMFGIFDEVCRLLTSANE